MRYRGHGDDNEQVIQVGQRPLLLTLWASWCQPCVAELQALAGVFNEMAQTIGKHTETLEEQVRQAV